MTRDPYPEIYFVRPSQVEWPIKVGFSINLDLRMASIAKWVPFPLEVLARLPVPASNVNWSESKQCGLFESRFHERYADHRLHHEWFEPHQLLLDDIAAINAGTFDPRCLPKGRVPASHTVRFIQTKHGLALEYLRILTPEQAKRERIAA